MQRGLNPALVRMGLLGLIETRNATAVLLASPEVDGGGIIQLAPGDTLPDGRVLTSVTDNSITLTGRADATGGDADAEESRGTVTEAERTHEEVLLLFPRGGPVPARRAGPRERTKLVVELSADDVSALRQVGRADGSNAENESNGAWDEQISDEQKLRFEQYLRKLEAREGEGQSD